jgi:hypothetical protein
VTQAEKLLSLNCLGVAASLRAVAHMIALLDRGNHPAVAGKADAAIIRTQAEAVHDALVSIAGRLASASP